MEISPKTKAHRFTTLPRTRTLMGLLHMLQHCHAGSSLLPNAGNILCEGVSCNATQCCTPATTCGTASPAVVCGAGQVG
jgi:hypothetical protein